METNKIKTLFKEYPITTAIIVIGVIVLISLLLLNSGLGEEMSPSTRTTIKSIKSTVNKINWSSIGKTLKTVLKAL